VNDCLQIYVIYFLSWFKMKKITLIFFTFSGIYTGFSQNPGAIADSITVKENTIANTPPIKNVLPVVKEKPAIRLFPNPAKNKVEIEISGFDPGYIKIQLIDGKGKSVREDKRLVFNGNEVIVLMFSEKPGLYFLCLKQGTKNIKSKLLVQ